MKETLSIEERFNNVPIQRLVLELGLPAMAAQIVNILYTIVDRIFVSFTPNGILALGAVGICGPLITALTGFAFMTGTGGSTVFSISLGEKNKDKAKKALYLSLIITVITSLILILIILIFKRPLLFLLGASEAMYVPANEYLSIYILGLGFNLVGLAMNQFVLAQGFSKTGMVSVVLGAVLNTLLDPLFIFVFGMGIGGAALATVISQFFVMCFVLGILLRKENPIPLRTESLDLSIIKRIISIGLMPLMITFLDNFILIALNMQLRRYGGDNGDLYIACAAILSSFMSLTVCLSGITQGCATLFGFHYGAGNLKKIKETFISVFRVCAVFLILLTVLSVGFPEVFVSLFTRDSVELKLASHFLRIYTIGIIGIGIQYAIVDGLVAMGEIKYSLPCSLIRKFLYLALLYLIPVFYPIEDIFWAGTISDLIGSAVTVLIFFSIVLPHLKKVL